MLEVIGHHKKTKRRSDYGFVQATDRDLYVLKWIGQMYAARLDHVQVLGALKSEDAAIQAAGQLGYSAVKNIYRRWLKAGWIEKQKLLVGKPQWLWLSRRGLQHVAWIMLIAPRACHDYTIFIR